MQENRNRRESANYRDNVGNLLDRLRCQWIVDDNVSNLLERLRCQWIVDDSVGRQRDQAIRAIRA